MGASLVIDVTATSADLSTAVMTFTVAINGLDEFDVSAVIDTTVLPDGVDESVVVGTTVGVTASASDNDATAGVSYSLTNNPGGFFASTGARAW